MKKLLCLILVLLLSMSVFVACTDNEAAPESEDLVVATDDKASETDDATNETPVADKAPERETHKEDTPSEKDALPKTEIIKPSEKQDKNSLHYYLILNGTNEENISYHTEKCPLLKDKETQKTSWEMIKMLQFRHCAKCNPPKYEGYVE